MCRCRWPGCLRASARIGAPHLPRRFDYQLELALLVVLGEQVADNVGREATLRADRELVERDEARGFVDPPLDLVDLFELRDLRADQAEHHDPALGDEAQRLKTARTRAVVFQQETIERQLVEHTLGNRVVGTLAVPHAAMITPAQM